MVSKNDLDLMTLQGCSNPECECSDGTVYIHCSTCGMGELAAVYSSLTGTLTLICEECEKPVVEVKIA